MLIWDGYGLESIHSGIGRHALHLAEELERLSLPPTIIPSVKNLHPAFQRFRAEQRSFPLSRLKPLALLAAGYQARGLAEAKGAKNPIFHGLSNYNIPELPKTFRTLVTVHDLIPFIFPDGVSSSLHRYLSYQMPKALRRAEAIVCVSEWTAHSVKNQFPHFAEKVLVIPNGKALRPQLEQSPSHMDRQRLRLLTVSRSETYKRIALIPEILKSLPADCEWHLVTDRRGQADLPVDARLRPHLAISDESLARLWAETDIFVHPSLWEGYCLPAATALAYDIPAVYCGGSGIDEVSGEAGLRLGPSEGPERWAEAILAVAADAQSFRDKARARWEDLPTWTDVAGQLKHLYANMSL